MSLYQKIAEIGPQYIGTHNVFKYGFNLSPMYRRTTAKIISVSEDIKKVTIKIPLSYKNKNYVNSIFGGSMFSAVDPIPMVQLINLLEKDYIVWDKSAEITFKIPAREDLYAEFSYTDEELDQIRVRLKTEDEIHLVKTTQLTNKAADKVFCEVNKTLYITTKSYFKNKKNRGRS